MLARSAQTRRYCEWNKLFTFLLEQLPADLQHLVASHPTSAQVDLMWESVKHHLYDNVKGAESTQEGAKHRKKIDAQSVYTAYECVVPLHLLSVLIPSVCVCVRACVHTCVRACVCVWRFYWRVWDGMVPTNIPCWLT